MGMTESSTVGYALHSEGKAEAASGVLHLIGNFHQGGSESQAVQLAGLLRESGHYSVRLAVMDPNGILRQEANRRGFNDIAEYPLTSFYDYGFVRQLRRFARQLRDLKIAIVHTHDFYSNVFGMAAAALAKVPVRIASRREIGGMRTYAQKWVEYRAYGIAHAVVANSEAVRQQLLREGIAEKKITTIYNGLDLGRFSQTQAGSREALVEFDLPGDGRPVVTLVANLRHSVKDHPTFLQAAARVHAQMPEAAFVLAGEGELLGSMQALAAQLGLGQSIFFLGRCTKIPQLLAISDVCVLSSRFEGFSNAVLEYMAAERPVVATDVGGIREAVRDGETGYIVPVGNAETMAARILTLLQDPGKARAMGKNGRKIVEQFFSTEALLARMEGFYDRLLRNARH